jgi:phosphotransferase system, enzyme I, PtsP
MLDTLRRLVQAVTDAENLDAALDLIVSRVKSIMQTGVCSVYLKDDASDRWVLMATDGLKPESVRKASLGLSEGLVGTVGTREELLNLDNAPRHPAFRFLRETGEEEFYSFLGVPIVHQRQVLGVLVVQQVTPRRFSDDEESLLITVAAQLSALIAHAKISGALRTGGGQGDEATGIDVHFKGVAGVPGIAMGTCLVRQPPAMLRRVRDRMTDDPERELATFQVALSAVKDELRRISQNLSASLKQSEMALFETYLRMLEDHALSGEVCRRIRSGESAETALKYVVLDLVARFEAMQDAYLRERGSDLLDLGRRILARLQDQVDDLGPLHEDTILVAEDVTPVMLGEIQKHRLKGIVSVKGSANSHVAILARSLGIPAVMGATDLPVSDLQGTIVVVDGWRGEVVANPSEAVRDAYQEAIVEAEVLQADLDRVGPGPCTTRDGHGVLLMLNSGLFGELSQLQRSWIGGVGLYRTEFAFLSRSRFPTEDEQRAIYQDELDQYSPNPVVMRTLDIGGDKGLPYFSFEESNPFLGWRGIRVTLDHPEIFITQIRAMLRASEGLDNLRILLPMVSTVAELTASKRLIARVLGELRGDGMHLETPEIGAMIEVPSAVYMAPELARQCDFLSVGSNDLTQYVMAVDRTNARVANLFDSLNPAVLRALDQTCQAARGAGIPVALCGEMAGDPMAAVLLVGLGFDELSMSGSSLAKVKRAVLAFDRSDCQSLASLALSLESGEQVLHLLSEAFLKHGLSLLLPPSLRDTLALEACQ